MTIEDLRTRWWTEPFQAFVVDMQDGRRIAVEKREWLALSPKGTQFMVCTADNDLHFLAVAQIKEIVDSQSTRANGQDSDG